MSSVHGGAPAALRGYRLQHLYVLYRMLCDANVENLAFQLEGTEDLEILEKNTGNLLEAIQVKAHSTDPVVLSDLFTDGGDSFFHRSLKRLDKFPRSLQKVVSYGPFGTRLAGAIANRLPDHPRTKTDLMQKGFTSAQAQYLLESTILETANETDLESKVYSVLKSTLVGTDADTAFLFLSGWMFNAMEKQHKITSADIQRRLTSVGQFIAETAQENRNWFSVIAPICDDISLQAPSSIQLSEEFYKGTYTTLTHIQAGLDIVRQSKLDWLKKEFNRSNIVVLHGASGQGKTALAYRYMLSEAKDAWRFEVRHLDSHQHALEVARVLSKHARAVGVQLFIYIDVAPLSLYWRSLVRELRSVSTLKLLITLREEDWARAKEDGVQLEVADAGLEFSKEEAEQVYSALVLKQFPDHLLDFQDAWSRFGATGPLMEFIHLVTQKAALRDRLATQISAIRTEVRLGRLSSNELDLLRQVAIFSAHGAKLDLARIADMLSIPDPVQTVRLFEKEYLIKLDVNGHFLEGLHSIRSEIIADLLTQDEPTATWLNSVTRCLGAVVESDLETFLTNALCKKEHIYAELVQSLQEFRPQRWSGMAGVLRTLLLAGVQRYLRNHDHVINALQAQLGTAWWMLLPFDLTGIDRQIDWSALLPGPMAEVRQALSEKIDNSASVLVEARKYLLFPHRPSVPQSAMEWTALAEVIFWMGHLDASGQIDIESQISDDTCNDRLVPLDAIADLVYAGSFWKSKRPQWWQGLQRAAIAKYRDECAILAIEDNGKKIVAHYLIKADLIGSSTEIFHAGTMERVNLVARLFPERESYGARGWGHMISMLPWPYDPASKTAIPRHRLPPRWLTRVNSLFLRLGSQSLNSVTWGDHARQTISVRTAIVACLDQITRFLCEYFEQEKPPGNRTLEDLRIALDRLDETLSNLPDAPDSHRGIDEIDEEEIKNKHKKYHDSANGYFRSVANFIRQSRDVLQWLPDFGRYASVDLVVSALRNVKKSGLDQNTAHLSVVNIFDAASALREFQVEFKTHFKQLMTVSDCSAVESAEHRSLAEVRALWSLFVRQPKTRISMQPVVAANSGRTLFKSIVHRSLDSIPTVNNAMKLAKTVVSPMIFLHGEPLSKANEVLLLPLESLRISILSQLQKLTNYKAQLLPKEITWEGKPAWVVTYDVSDAGSYNHAFELVVNALTSSIPAQLSTELLLLLQHQARYICVIPLVGGKSLDGTAWRFGSASLPRDSDPRDENRWKFVRIPVEESAWKQLGLPIWESEDLAKIAALTEQAAHIRVLVEHMLSLAEAPTEDAARAMVDTYIKERILSLSDLASKMISDFKNLVTGLPLDLVDRESARMLESTFTPDSKLLLTERENFEPLREWADRLGNAQIAFSSFQLGLAIKRVTANL